MKLPRSDRRFFTDPFSRIVTAAVLGLSSVIPPAVAQTAPPAEQSPPPVPASPPVPAPPAAQTLPAAPEPVPQKPVYSISDLEYILGPIALYPDPLLAVLLPATAFPMQIAEADQWIAANPDKVKRGDFTEVDAKPWDASVQALARFPDVIEMLTDHIDWTESLGMAFALQPDDVGTTIQMLRAKAEKAGNLQTTPQQVVTTREDSGSRVIYIQPASPERIYVPTYDPVTVFDTVVPSALMFGTGIIVGSIWNDRWGWNNRHWHQVWVHPPAWHWRPPPPNWRPPPRPGRPPGARPPGAWRPDRPGGIRPDRPGGIRPDRPGIGRPDRPGGRPDLPNRPGVGRPDRPGLPGSRPDLGARPDRPNLRPDRPAMPGTPGAIRPDRPGARPDRPAIPNRPGAGAQRPERPQGQRPQVQRPQGQRPQVQRPQGQRPQVQRPQGQRPQVQRPQGQRPQVQRPQGQRPQVQRPQAQRPQIQRPQAQRPQARPQQMRPQARPPAARPAAPARPRPQGGGGPRQRPQR